MPLRFWKDALVVVPALSALTAEQDTSDLKYSATRQRCSRYLKQKIEEIGCPGLVVGVSINGRNVWTKAFGYSDLENNVRCKPDTVMRIASISKSLTAAAVAKLMEEGKLDIEQPIQKYVPNFPAKKFNGKDVTVTTKMLLSHTGGIRHYNKRDDGKIDEGDSFYDEFYSMKPYKSVVESLNMFKDDPLVRKPGKNYLYTTHGFTLVSAVVEGACGENFADHMQALFNKFGMKSTYSESATRIIYNRARHYVRTAKGRLENVRYVDLSYKWAGGGFISTVPDLLKFGNIMLYSYQDPGTLTPPSYIKKETARMLWSPVVKTNSKSKNSWYGLGWELYSEVKEIGCGLEQDFEATHTGGAVGASSVLYICPGKDEITISAENASITTEEALIPADNSPIPPPKGVVVAIITNLQSVPLTKIAREIANEFKSVAT